MYDWVKNTFVEFSPHSQNLLSLQEEEEQLTELQYDRTMKIKYNEVSPDVFWISIRKEYLSKSSEHLTPVFNFLPL
jgi:hypothetical protein